MYVPRALTSVALRFLYGKGKLLVDMLAGAGNGRLPIHLISS